MKIELMDIPGGLKGISRGIGEATIRLEKEKPDEVKLDILTKLIGQGVKIGAYDLVLEHTCLLDGSVPVLLCYQSGAVKLPLVFLCHGVYPTSKERMVNFGISMANAGFFTVMSDAPLHGERKPPNAEELLGMPAWFETMFGSVFKGTVEEISAMIDLFTDDPRVDATRVGIAGVSMGGFIAYLAVTMEKRIRAAVSLNGSPEWSLPAHIPPGMVVFTPETQKIIADLEPIHRPERFYPTALLMQNGINDPVVSVKGVRTLHEKLTPRYADQPENLELVEYQAGHDATPEMERMAVEWLRTRLG